MPHQKLSTCRFVSRPGSIQSGWPKASFATQQGGSHQQSSASSTHRFRMWPACHRYVGETLQLRYLLRQEVLSSPQHPGEIIESRKAERGRDVHQLILITNFDDIVILNFCLLFFSIDSEPSATLSECKPTGLAQSKHSPVTRGQMLDGPKRKIV